MEVREDLTLSSLRVDPLTDNNDIDAVTVQGPLSVNSKLKLGTTGVVPFAGFTHAATESTNGVVEVSADTTLSAATHHGKVVVVTAASKTITLPAVALGASYTIVNGAADGSLLTISPNASDKFLIDAAGGGGTDDKDLINTAATAKKGDFVSLLGMTADGWAITYMSGTWADES